MVYNTTSVQSDVNILLRHSSVCNEWNFVEIFVSYTIIRFVDLHLYLKGKRMLKCGLTSLFYMSLILSTKQKNEHIIRN